MNHMLMHIGINVKIQGSHNGPPNLSERKAHENLSGRKAHEKLVKRGWFCTASV